MKRGCLLSLVLLVAVASAVMWFLRVPSQAERTFGAPDPALGFWSRWRLSRTLLAHTEELTAPMPATAGLTLEVLPGETASAVARRLQNRGVIPDADAFLAFLRYKGWDTDVQAGTFRFQRALTPVALAEALRHRPPTDAVLVVLPGWRREEIAAAVPSSGLAFDAEAFLRATASAEGYALPFAVPAGATLEGFLAPGTYTLPRTSDPAIVAAQMVERASQWLAAPWQRQVEAQGLTPYQGLVLASIVQRETRHEEEMPLIAAVYLRRLALQMPLEADPTVQYALGRPGAWWPSPLSWQDLQVNSPYNTYHQPGLPPAPIANPGEAALQAVAAAPQTRYLFFRAACDGSGYHVFAETFDQHVENACP